MENIETQSWSKCVCVAVGLLETVVAQTADAKKFGVYRTTVYQVKSPKSSAAGKRGQKARKSMLRSKQKGFSVSKSGVHRFMTQSQQFRYYK